MKPTPGEIQAAEAFVKEVGLRKAAEEKLAAGRKYLRAQIRNLKWFKAGATTSVADVRKYTESALRVLDGKPAAKAAKTKTKGKGTK